MQKLVLFLLSFLVITSCVEEKKRIWLDETDLSKMEAGWGSVQVNKSVEGNPLSVGGRHFERGIGTHAISKVMIDLHGKACNLHGLAGVDDESGEKASVEFFILGDKNILWQSGIMKKSDSAISFDINLSGINKLALYISDGGDYIHYDHADWLDTWIEYRGDAPSPVEQPRQEPYILTPEPAKEPHINGPKVYGATPGKPFLYKVPVTGERPVKIVAKGLPPGLRIDQQTGIISGRIKKQGEYKVRLKAENEHGSDEKSFYITAGDKLALTPPLGWNSWNCWGLSVSDSNIRAAADAMVKSGLIEYGWTYINIDDGWEAPERTANGELLSNDKFPDMKALADYVHGKGLKLGIYSSPGTTTCGGYLGSWEHEAQDAETWAGWGIDYLKYDWCSYHSIALDQSLPELKKPYIHMRKVLDRIPRDIVYSLCQYGMGNVCEWGAEVGGNLWRTTYDITDSWNSMSGIGFSQDICSPYAGPGHWNDPDMLVVGRVGWGPSLHESRLSPDEQYTHISLWCLLSAPLLLGCDMSNPDDFTLGLLTNDEVLAVNQDPLGKQAIRIVEADNYQVWSKELEDGALAVGIFNTGTKSPVEAFNWNGEISKQSISISWDELGIEGKQLVRDLWRQKDLGEFNDIFETRVPYHGVTLVTFTLNNSK